LRIQALRSRITLADAKQGTVVVSPQHTKFGTIAVPWPPPAVVVFRSYTVEVVMQGTSEEYTYIFAFAVKDRTVLWLRQVKTGTPLNSPAKARVQKFFMVEISLSMLPRRIPAFRRVMMVLNKSRRIGFSIAHALQLCTTGIDWKTQGLY